MEHTGRAAIADDTDFLAFQVDRMVPSCRVEAVALETLESIHSWRLIQGGTEASNRTDDYVCIQLEDLLGVQGVVENDLV